MSQDKRRRRGPQSFLPAPEEIDKSPLWQSIRRMQDGVRSMRERGLLPKLSPEMPERLRQMRETLERSAWGEMAREERERRLRELDEEQRKYKAELRHIEERAKAEQETRKQQPSGKRGAPRLKFPHLPDALDALEKKWPDAKRSEAKHIRFVISFLRKHGDNVERVRNDDGTIDETQSKTISRRINERLKARKAQSPLPMRKS